MLKIIHCAYNYWYHSFIIIFIHCSTIDEVSLHHSDNHNIESSKLSNYRSVSKLSSISKSKERIVARQLIYYIISNSIVEYFQSAYLPNRSTETALNIMFNDIVLSIDKASCYLVLLDLPSAFDTLKHRILSYRLREIDIHGQVYN